MTTRIVNVHDTGDGDGEQAELERVGELFTQFVEAVARRPRAQEGEGRDVTARLRAHLGTEPGQLPVVKGAYAPYDHPNVHLALERWFAAEGRSYELIGMTGSDHRGHYTLSEILETASRYEKFVIGAVDYAHLPVSPDQEMACV
ncbi:hypothetical protein RB200_26810 [Streptomyces sp. PmtG]